MKNKFDVSSISKVALALAMVSFIALAASCGSPVAPPAATEPAITIDSPWVKAVPQGPASGAFMNIVNAGGEDKLIGASSPISSIVEIHEMVMDGDKMKMSKIDSLPVPANGTLVLKPRDYHIMFLDLKKGLKEGEKVEIELNFEKSGVKKVTAEVKPMPPMPKS